MRIDRRNNDEMRTIRFRRNFTAYAEGSVLVEFGRTKVICTATVENKVPRFLKGQGQGWITAEYALLPRSTHTRNAREVMKGKQSGRTVEIQRLIGRALRSVVKMEALGEVTITLDCDVIQADGGTRTAAISGAFVAMVDAIARVHNWEEQSEFPVKDYLAAVSVGKHELGMLLDLCYAEDSVAVVDMNVVRTGNGQLVEVQGTGEHGTFSRAEMNELLDLAEKGIDAIIAEQKFVLEEINELIGAVREKDSTGDEK